jgi:hypothetical protein
VHVISNLATLFGFNADAVSSALRGPTMGAAGRQIMDETFFINTMVPVNNPDVFQQYQNNVMTNMSGERHISFTFISPPYHYHIRWTQEVLAYVQLLLGLI